MKVETVTTLLGELKDIHAAASSKSAPVKDTQTLIDALSCCSDADYFEILSIIQDGLGGDQSGADAAEVHLAALLAAGTDDARFRVALKALAADKALKPADLDQIGARYLKFPKFGKAYKSRTAKLKQIERGFAQKQDFESRAAVIDEVSPWQ